MNDGERGPRESGRELARGVAAIAVVGAVLGLAFNALQLAAGGRHGLSWTRRETKLETLQAIDRIVSAAALDSARAHTAPPPAATDTTPAATPPKPAPSKPAAATKAAPAPAVAEPVAPPTPPAPKVAVPFVPDTREPMEVAYDLTRKFWDAGAAVFVDARSAQEYAEGHIPGAVNLDFDDVQRKPELAGQLDTHGRAVIVTYCSGGTCELSRHLATALIEAGHHKVLVFTGGMPAWQAAGGRVVTGPARGEAP
jgi:rhodanese-related sulfurtransferase